MARMEPDRTVRSFLVFLQYGEESPVRGGIDLSNELCYFCEKPIGKDALVGYPRSYAWICHASCARERAQRKRGGAA